MRRLYIHKCAVCPEQFGLSIYWQDYLFSPKKCQALVADYELAVQIHRTDHVLDILNIYNMTNNKGGVQ